MGHLDIHLIQLSQIFHTPASGSIELVFPKVCLKVLIELEADINSRMLTWYLEREVPSCAISPGESLASISDQSGHWWSQPWHWHWNMKALLMVFCLSALP